MKIGELANAAATTAETIRYYERIGLLPQPERTKGNYRTYSAEHFERLDFIRKARRLGFEIDEIRALMSLDGPTKSSDAGQVAAGYLAAIEDKIAQLKGLKTALNSIVKPQAAQSPAETKICQSLAGHSSLQIDGR